ncbi:MAG TPA: glycine zipper domain-containing protein [Chitinophagaceae bacterium]|nr:glycine zipper domain-containing protein [Chitinophagaceae bacterium]
MKANFFFKIGTRFFLLLVILGFGQITFSQQQVVSLPDTSKMTYNQISSGMNKYVFPSKGQSQQKQKEDEFECYKWAVQQSGIDPLNLPKVEVKQTETGPDGSAVRGAARGAAAGAAIGAIGGDAGEGAAIGAVAGGLAGRRAGKQAKAQQAQQADAAVKQTEQAMKDSFTKAFSACIEGKGYTIK